MNRKLYRSKTDVKISGVCGGLAVYSGIDVTIIRLVWAVASLFTALFMGIIIYFVCAIIIPVEPDVYDADYREKKDGI